MANKQITFWINEEDRRRFSERYKTSMSKFFRNCIKLALLDKKFFNDVYFMDLQEDIETTTPLQESIF